MTTTTETIECPACRGKGKTACLWDGVDKRTGRSVGGLATGPCGRCQGAGRIDARMVGWMERGKELARLRRLGGRSLLHAVGVLEAGLTEISAAETGRIDPERFIARALAAGWDRGVRP